MTKQEMKNKVVETREELRQVLSNMTSVDDGMTDRQKFDFEKQLEDVIASLTLIILSSDFDERRHREQEVGYVSSEDKNL